MYRSYTSPVVFTCYNIHCNKTCATSIRIPDVRAYTRNLSLLKNIHNIKYTNAKRITVMHILGIYLYMSYVNVRDILSMYNEGNIQSLILLVVVLTYRININNYGKVCYVITGIYTFTIIHVVTPIINL